MARPQRFSIKMEFWTTPEQSAALEALEAQSMLSKSDHLRQAMNLYLRQLGMISAPRPIMPNGQQPHHGARAEAQ
jgi:hypothetical protein